MASSNLTVALCQMTSTDDVESNLMQIEDLIGRIPTHSHVRAAFFPENSLFFRIKEKENVRGLFEDDAVFNALKSLAVERKMHLHFTAPFRDQGHLYNNSIWINDLGVMKVTYQKMHLFDIALTNGPQIRESDVFRHGGGPSIIEIDGWKFGESICYDLRFAELFSLYARQQVDGILIPAAFLPKTGEAHWDILIRARAIESQCFVLAAAQGGVHQGVSGGVRETYGNSLLVDPWGTVLERIAHRGPDIAIHNLKRSALEQVRTQIPMRDHRRLPVGS